MVSLSAAMSSSLITLILGVVIANLTSKLIKRIIRESNAHKLVNKSLGKNLKLDIYLSDLAKYSIWVFTAIIIMKQFGVNESQLKTAILVILLFILVMIFLAFKDFIPSIFFGIYLLKSKKIKKGKTIIFKGIKGKVIDINLVETRIETNNKEEISIPNMVVWKNLRR